MASVQAAAHVSPKWEGWYRLGGWLRIGATLAFGDDSPFSHLVVEHI